MKIVIPKTLCRYRNKPDATCRKLPRCSRCGNKIYSGGSGGYCSTCNKHDADAYRLSQAEKLIRECAVENGGGDMTAVHIPPPEHLRVDHQERERCERCGGDTLTVLLPLSSGHIGRCCARCRACRRLRPFASKVEFQNLKNADTHEGRGLTNDRNEKPLS